MRNTRTPLKKTYKKTKRFFERPDFNRHFNGWAAVFFAVLIIPSILLNWLENVAFVSVLSIWALVASHWAAWQGARVEQKEDIAAATKRKPVRVSRFRIKHKKLHSIPK